MSLREAAKAALEVLRMRSDAPSHKALEALSVALAEVDNADDKALRFDLDRAGIEQREREAVELVELRSALTDLKAWKEAVHDALVILFELNEKNADDPRQAVADLVAAEVRIALDPAVSSDVQALIDRGRAESAGAEPVAPQATFDCRLCKHFTAASGGCTSTVLCVDARQFQPTTPRRYWKSAATPAREAESVVNQQLMTELSDEEIQRIWDDTDEAPTFSQTLVAFARAVLAAARGKG